MATSLLIPTRCMKSLLASASVLVLTAGVQGQTVQKCCGTSNSTFLWGSPTSNHTQCLFVPGDLANAQPGDILRLYYRYGTTAQNLGNTLTNVVVRLGATTATSFQSGNLFFNGLDTVIDRATLSIPPGNTGDWFEVELDQPFAFDPQRTLIVDVYWTGSQNATFGTYGTSNNGRKLYSNNNTSPTGITTSTTWQDIAFDLDLGTGIVDRMEKTGWVYPNPAHDRIHITLDAGVAKLELFDAMGRCVMSLPAGTRSATVGELSPGAYVMRVTDQRGQVWTERLVRAD